MSAIPVTDEVIRPTWPQIAVINDPSSGLTDAQVGPMVAAIAKQVIRDFGPVWHIGAHFHFVAGGQRPPGGMWHVAVLGSSDQAGALGYHDLTPDGLPLGKVFAATDRQYGEQVSVTLSHEVLEMLGDPWINLAAQAADGRFYAWEACDAVEADPLGYKIDGVPVSAFVAPSWFGNGPAPYSFPTGVLGKAFQIAPGGYISVFDPSSGQGWSQLQAERDPHSLTIIGQALGLHQRSPIEQIKAVPRVGSRRERRFRGRGNWVHSTYEIG